MSTITSPWETWRALIAVLREKVLPYMLEHADHLERQLEHAEETVTLYLADDEYWRSFDWARWQLGIQLPTEP